MTPVLEKLFDTYGDTVLREHELYDEAEIMAALDEMSMDRSTKVRVCDLLFARYLRWSTAAFSAGLHLGLSLAAEIPSPRKNP